jgi:hypothetical protein
MIEIFITAAVRRSIPIDYFHLNCPTLPIYSRLPNLIPSRENYWNFENSPQFLNIED